MVKRRREGRIDIGRILLFLAAVAGAYYAWVQVPPWWTSRRVEEIIELCLRQYRDTNRTKAQGLLESELRKRDIPGYLEVGDCELFEKDDAKHISCTWVAELEYPLINRTEERYYQVHLSIDERGEIWREEDEEE